MGWKFLIFSAISGLKKVFPIPSLRLPRGWGERLVGYRGRLGLAFEAGVGL